MAEKLTAVCRGCGASLETCQTLISYKKTSEVTARWIEGQPYETSRAVADAGLFCSDDCLVVFLRPHLEQKLQDQF